MKYSTINPALAPPLRILRVAAAIARRRAAPLSLLAALLLAMSARGAATNRVTAIDVEAVGEARRVRIQTAAEPTFTVFRLSNPMRVVVDLSGGDLSGVEGPIAVEDGVVGQIALRQFSADGFLIGRVIVGFEHDLTYDVHAEGRAVVVRTARQPGSAVDRAAPPPIAPIDRAAAERFETARREAESAAARAASERERAERAAAFALEQQREAARIAKTADEARAAAERAKAEAESLRQQVAQAAARDRETAQQAARLAELRMAEAERAAQHVAKQRAEADRIAAEARRAQRDAEEIAARAVAQHKQSVAQLEEQAARTQREKQAAAAARARAEAAKREAEAAERAAREARQAAERTRKETSEKLAEIAERQRRAEAALARVAGEKQDVERLKKEVTERAEEIAAREAQLDKQQRHVERQLRDVRARQASLVTTQEAIDSERERLALARQQIERSQKRLDVDRSALKKAEERFEARRVAHRAHRRGLKANRAEVAKLEAEREEVERLKKAVAAAQAKIDQDRKAVVRASTKLERAQAERRAVQREHDRLDTKRRAIAAERRSLDRARAELKEERVAARRAKAALKKERKALKKERVALRRERVRSGAAGATPVMNVATPRTTRAGTSASLRGIRRQGVGRDAGVLLLLDRTPSYQTQRLENPPRLVIDLADTARTAPRVTYGVDSPFIRRVRLGDHGSVTRVVMDLSAENAKHMIKSTDQGLLVRLEPPPEADPTYAAVTAPAAAAVTAAWRGDVANIRDVRFTGGRDVARVIVDVDNAAIARVDDRSKRAWVLELRGATVPKALERSLDTTAYGSVVRLVSTYQVSEEPAIVNVVANLAGPATHDLQRKNGALVWEIRGRARPTQVATAATPQTAGFAAEASVIARSTPKQTRRKRKVNLDLVGADIVNVIRLLAEISGENIIAGDDVKGQVTLRLRNVPWDKALDTILKSKGYDRVRHHNIIRIAPAAKLQEERERAISAKKQREQVEDTVIKMITINYATASEVVVQLKPLMSGRGSVQTDDRTNTIIVEDIKSNVGRIVELTRRLDKQTPQVLIEARIVEASSNNLRELGIQWGGTTQMSAVAGNPTGLIFPGDVIVNGAGDDRLANFDEGAASPGRFAVNLPAPIGSGAGGGLGFVFGSAGGSQLLNLRLTALEESGKGRIISSPRVTTLDNRTAKIAQGVDIPITVTSAAGANTRFIPARLELEVTPHVTNDGSVLMKIKTSKNAPNFVQVGGQGDPTIETKEAETEVLVRDGDTTVIGGIYTRTESENYASVPFFGDIPVIGWLFKKKRSEVKRAELLVFITPRIVNREESMVRGGSTLPGRPPARER